MFNYILKRVLLAIPVLVGITIVTFLLVYKIPGNPVVNLVGERVSADVVKALNAQLGLDKPIHVQYLNFIGKLLKGDLGRSFITGLDVKETLLKRFPNTLILTVIAIIFAVSAGILIGILTAVNRDTLIDRLGMSLALLGISTPVFLWGLVLMLVFAVYLNLLPPSGNYIAACIILPAVTLGTRSLAFIARVTRSSMLEVMNQDYIRTARAKGLTENTVVFKHGLKNALMPIVTLIGLDFGSYLSGAIITETVFNWPGIGTYALDGIAKRDIPVIMGTVLFTAVIFVLVNLIVDLVYSVIDPRVRYE